MRVLSDETRERAETLARNVRSQDYLVDEDEA
jgi:hypothetical protein